jgi:hypothetical protein
MPGDTVAQGGRGGGRGGGPGGNWGRGRVNPSRKSKASSDIAAMERAISSALIDGPATKGGFDNTGGGGGTSGRPEQAGGRQSTPTYRISWMRLTVFKDDVLTYQVFAPELERSIWGPTISGGGVPKPIKTWMRNEAATRAGIRKVSVWEHS